MAYISNRKLTVLKERYEAEGKPIPGIVIRKLAENKRRASLRPLIRGLNAIAAKELGSW